MKSTTSRSLSGWCHFLWVDPLNYFHYLKTVMDEHLWIVIKLEGSRIDVGRFINWDMSIVQEQGLLLGHVGIRQPAFWCCSEEGLKCVRCYEYKILIQHLLTCFFLFLEKQ